MLTLMTMMRTVSGATLQAFLCTLDFIRWLLVEWDLPTTLRENPNFYELNPALKGALLARLWASHCTIRATHKRARVEMYELGGVKFPIVFVDFSYMLRTIYGATPEQARALRATSVVHTHRALRKYDGIYIDPEYFASLSPIAQKKLLGHELGHIPSILARRDQGELAAGLINNEAEEYAADEFSIVHNGLTEGEALAALEEMIRKVVGTELNPYKLQLLENRKENIRKYFR